MRYLVLITLLITLGTSGCASTGLPKISAVPEQKKATIEEKSAKFVKGKTTYSEVVRELGEPFRISNFNDGKWVDYEGYATLSQGRARKKILHMRFDTNDVLYLKVINPD